VSANARNANSEAFRVVEHQDGTLLRLQTTEIYAMDAAVGLLGALDAELHADVEDNGWKRGFGLKVATPVKIRLESLEAELTTDGNEIVVRRTGGNKQEFEDLCDFIRERAGPPTLDR
jgi:hypothetical protein